MKVLADFHHQALYHSLRMLFEDRLGWELYRPIGEDWFREGFWNVYNHPHTVNQFLGVHQGTDRPMDIRGKLLPECECKNLHYRIEDGIYYIKDVTFDTQCRAVGLQKFKEMEFDIILSSIPQHIRPHQRLISMYQPKAKHIFQVGNQWGNQANVNNIMASTAPFATSANAVFYHQEFDLDVFKYEPPTIHNVAHSYVHYMKHPRQLQQIFRELPGWNLITFGAGMQEQLGTAKLVAEKMRDSAFTWHYKPGGDGFGHVIHSTYACGRPALIWRQHYHGCCIADALFQDKVTCIDVSNKTPSNIATLIKRWSQPEEHTKMCEAAYNRFNQVVNFDEEFAKIKKFLDRLR